MAFHSRKNPFLKTLSSCGEQSRSNGQLTKVWNLRGCHGQIPKNICQRRKNKTKNCETCAFFVGFPVSKNAKQRKLENHRDSRGRLMSKETFLALDVDTGSFYMAQTEITFDQFCQNSEGKNK